MGEVVAAILSGLRTDTFTIRAQIMETPINIKRILTGENPLENSLLPKTVPTNAPKTIPGGIPSHDKYLLS